MSRAICTGDWVRMYRQGIWQVYRVLAQPRAWDPGGDMRPRTTVFGKRITTDTFKQSFGESACDEAFVTPLAPRDLSRLQAMLERDLDLGAQFATYVPRPIDAIFNANVAIPAGQSSAAFAASIESRIPKDAWYEAGQIAEALAGLGLTNGRGATLQFVSPDHTARDGALIYRFAKTLG